MKARDESKFLSKSTRHQVAELYREATGQKHYRNDTYKKLSESLLHEFRQKIKDKAFSKYNKRHVNNSLRQSQESYNNFMDSFKKLSDTDQLTLETHSFVEAKCFKQLLIDFNSVTTDIDLYKIYRDTVLLYNAIMMAILSIITYKNKKDYEGMKGGMDGSNIKVTPNEDLDEAKIEIPVTRLSGGGGGSVQVTNFSGVDNTNAAQIADAVLARLIALQINPEQAQSGSLVISANNVVRQQQPPEETAFGILTKWVKPKTPQQQQLVLVEKKKQAKIALEMAWNDLAISGGALDMNDFTNALQTGLVFAMMTKLILYAFYVYTASLIIKVEQMAEESPKIQEDIRVWKGVGSDLGRITSSITWGVGRLVGGLTYSIAHIDEILQSEAIRQQTLLDEENAKFFWDANDPNDLLKNKTNETIDEILKPVEQDPWYEGFGDKFRMLQEGFKTNSKQIATSVQRFGADIVLEPSNVVSVTVLFTVACLYLLSMKTIKQMSFIKMVSEGKEKKKGKGKRKERRRISSSSEESEQDGGNRSMKKRNKNHKKTYRRKV